MDDDGFGYGCDARGMTMTMMMWRLMPTRQTRASADGCLPSGTVVAVVAELGSISPIWESNVIGQEQQQPPSEVVIRTRQPLHRAN